MSNSSRRPGKSTLHIWEGQNFADVDLLIQRRDPRRFTLGCATGNGETTVLQWFRNMPEIAQWLRRMEPQRWGLKGPALIHIKAELEPVLTGVDVHGLNEASREAHNRITDAHYQVEWWGDFQTLAGAADEWSRQLLERHEIRPSGHDGAERLEQVAKALRQRVDDTTH